ncbi:MAG: glycosyltransferase family 4 protein [Desulfovibrio sp.]|jgi:glycosyltransferase involved in cell wall biosynthesis
MNIAGIIFESLLKTGGYEIFTYNLFKTLARRGNNVTLYVPSREIRKRGDFYAQLPFVVRPMIPNTAFFLKHAPRMLQQHLAWEQRRHRYDVWQVMGAWPEGFAVKHIRAPKMLRCYGEDVQLAPQLGYGVRRDPLLDDAVCRVVRSMDRVVAMTPSLAELLRGMGVADAAIARIPNGIDVQRFGRPVDREAVRNRLDVPSGAFLLLTVGRNHPKKGFDLIPRMAARLKQSGKHFTWLVVGGETNTLLPALRAEGVQDVVRPMPAIRGSSAPEGAARLELPTDALLDLYGAADLFVFPSRLEGFSRVLIESLAAGLPVVTTDAPGCGETFEAGQQGFVSPVDQPDPMADNIQRLMDDADLLQRLSVNAREFSQAFDWNCIAERYEKQYREVIQKS